MAVQESAAQLSMTLKVQEYPTLKVGLRAGRGRLRVPASRGGRGVAWTPGGVWGPGYWGLGGSGGSAGCAMSGFSGAAGSAGVGGLRRGSFRARGLGVGGPSSRGLGACGYGGLRGRVCEVWGVGLPGGCVLRGLRPAGLPGRLPGPARRVWHLAVAAPGWPGRASWQGGERVCLAPGFALRSRIVAPSPERA